MSLINFGASNSQQGVFTRIKPYPTPNIKGLLPVGAIPVVRSGNKNYYTFNKTNTVSDAGYRSVVSLYTTNPTALVLAFDVTTVSATAKIHCSWLSSTDQCLYFVFSGVDGLIRLAKMNDSTGAVTQIGSGFTPATPANWSYGGTKLEQIASDLRYTYNGKYHTLNKSTGAVISQDNSFVLSGYESAGADYVSLDGSFYSTGDIQVTPVSTTTSAIGGSLILPYCQSASVGNLPAHACDPDLIFGARVYGYATSTQIFPINTVLVDNDKIAFTTYLTGTGVPISIALRSSYDATLQSIIDWGAGIR